MTDRQGSENKIATFHDIDANLIQSWKTPQVESLLNSQQAEEELLHAYENGLYETPVDPKISPREMIYALDTEKDFTPRFIQEVKALTRQWIAKTASTWNQTITPFYSAELDYILSKT